MIVGTILPWRKGYRLLIDFASIDELSDFAKPTGICLRIDDGPEYFLAAALEQARAGA